VCLMTALGTNLQMSALDTLAAPLAAKYMGWSIAQTSGLFAFLAIISLIGAGIGINADKRGVKPLRMILIGAALNLVSTFVLVISLGLLLQGASNLALFMIFLSGCLLVISIFLYAGPNGGIYQQACGNSQGFLGGFYAMCFAGGRPVGSFLAGWLLDGSSMPLSFALVICVTTAFALRLAFRQRLEKTARDALLPRDNRPMESGCRDGELAVS